MTNEQGEKVSGFVFSDDNPFRNLTVSWRVGSNLETSFLGPEKHIRSGQGKDMEEWSRGSVLNESRPRGLRFGSKDAMPPTVASIKALVEEATKPAEHHAKDEVKLDAAMPPPPQPLQKGTEAQELSGDDTDSGEELNPAAMLAAGKAALKERKGKGKGKGGKSDKEKKRTQGSEVASSSKKPRSGGGGSTPSSSAAPSASARQSVRSRSRSPPVAPSEQSIGAASVASSQKSTTTGDRLIDQARKYDGVLERILEKIVIGVNMGNDINNAKRAHAALSDRDPGHGDAVSLTGQLQLANLAQKLKVQSIASVPRQERIEGVSQLFPRLRVVPPAWASSLFLLAVKDLMPELGQEKVQQKWLDIISPVSAQPGDRP